MDCRELCKKTSSTYTNLVSTTGVGAIFDVIVPGSLDSIVQLVAASAVERRLTILCWSDKRVLDVVSTVSVAVTPQQRCG